MFFFVVELFSGNRKTWRLLGIDFPPGFNDQRHWLPIQPGHWSYRCRRSRLSVAATCRLGSTHLAVAAGLHAGRSSVVDVTSVWRRERSCDQSVVSLVSAMCPAGGRSWGERRIQERRPRGLLANISPQGRATKRFKLWRISSLVFRVSSVSANVPVKGGGWPRGLFFGPRSRRSREKRLSVSFGQTTERRSDWPQRLQ